MFLMIYACIYVDVLCVISCLGFVDSLDPCDHILTYMYVEEVTFAWFEKLKGRRRWFAVEAEFWMNSGSAAEGSFGRRTSCMVA